MFLTSSEGVDLDEPASAQQWKVICCCKVSFSPEFSATWSIKNNNDNKTKQKTLEVFIFTTLCQEATLVPQGGWIRKKKHNYKTKWNLSLLLLLYVHFCRNIQECDKVLIVENAEDLCVFSQRVEANLCFRFPNLLWPLLSSLRVPAPLKSPCSCCVIHEWNKDTRKCSKNLMKFFLDSLWPDPCKSQ